MQSIEWHESLNGHPLSPSPPHTHYHVNWLKSLFITPTCLFCDCDECVWVPVLRSQLEFWATTRVMDTWDLAKAIGGTDSQTDGQWQTTVVVVIVFDIQMMARRSKVYQQKWQSLLLLFLLLLLLVATKSGFLLKRFIVNVLVAKRQNK